MAIVPKNSSPMPKWAKQAIDHLEYAASILAENGVTGEANRLDSVIFRIMRHELVNHPRSR